PASVTTRCRRGTSSLTPSTTSPGSSRSSPRCLGDGTAFAFPFPTRSRDGNHAGEPAGQGSKMSRGASDDDLDARYWPWEEGDEFPGGGGRPRAGSLWPRGRGGGGRPHEVHSLRGRGGRKGG